MDSRSGVVESGTPPGGPNWPVVMMSSGVFLWALLGKASVDRLGMPQFPIQERFVVILVVLLVPGALVIYRSRRGAWLGRHNSLATPLLVLLLGLALSSAWGIVGQEAFALEPLRDLLALGLGVGGAWLASSADPLAAARTYAWLSLVSALGLAALGLATGVAGAGQRLAVLGGGPNIYARMIGLGIVGLIFLVGTRAVPSWAILGTPVMIIPIMLSGSRGGMLSTGVAVAIGSIWILSDSIGRLRSLLWASAVCVLGLALLAGTRFGQDAAMTFQTRVVDLTLKQEYSAGRDRLYAEAVQAVGNHPLKGNGLGGFSQIMGYPEYPHNLVLDIAVSAGAVGLLALGWAVVAFVRTTVRTRASLTARYLVVSVLLVLVGAMTSGGIYDSRFIWIYAVTLGGIAARELGSAESSVPTRPGSATRSRIRT